MTFKVEFTFSNLDELQAFIAGKTEGRPEQEAPKPVTRTPRGPKPEPVAAAPVEKLPGNTSKIPFKAKEEAPAEPEVDYNLIADATTGAVKAGHRDSVVALLKKYKAINDAGKPDAKALPMANRAAYLEECAALTAAPDENELA